MTTAELEEILSKYKVTKSRKKRREAENISMPFMLSTFNDLIKKDVPPTQDNFIRTFKRLYPKYRMLGVTDRLKRSYTAYIREYHLGFLLKDVFKTKAEIIYATALDLAGVDYVVRYKGLEFNIHAFIDTANGRYWRGVKNTRHDFVGVHLDVPLDLGRCKKVGSFSLYPIEQVKELKKTMDEIVKTKKK